MYPCSKYLFNLQKPIIVWENVEKSLEGGNKKAFKPNNRRVYLVN